MNCNHALGFLDLIPIFSWIFLKGKCRYCGTKISVRYVLAEVFMAAMTVLCLLQFDLTLLALRNFIVLCCLFALSMTDIENMTIPNRFLITMAVVWAAYLPFSGNILEYLKNGLIAGAAFGAGILLISLLMDKLLHKDTMGGGDIKLFAVVGLYLGIWNGLLCIIASCIIGLVIAICTRKKRSEPFPFGPSIALAFWFCLLYGQTAVNGYMQLFA